MVLPETKKLFTKIVKSPFLLVAGTRVELVTSGL